MDKNIKIKISDYTRNKESEVSNFSVSYSARKIDNSISSHEIISALKAEDNFIIEINSSLLSLSVNDKRNFLLQFIDLLETKGIEFRKKKTLENAKLSFLSIRIDSKKIEGYELFAYIPNEIWKDQEFSKSIPKNGVRYYLLKACSENNLDAFVNLEEDEKLEQCRMVIFDNILLGSMGINTSILKKDDIIELLNK